MAFYHDVSQGEPFKPNMGLSNDVRHLLNAFGGVGAPRIDNSLPQRALVATYISGASISAGLPVTLSSSDGEEITGAPFATGDIAYGVNIQDVESGVGGRAVVGGVAMISGITGTAGTYTHVTPISGGWEYADDGLPLIWASGTAGLAFVEHTVGGFNVGTSLTKTLEADGSTLEAVAIKGTTEGTMVTMACGRDTRISGDTTTHRPTVAQGQALIRTGASFVTPYHEITYSELSTQTLSVLESDKPPTSGSGVAYLDGKAFGSTVTAQKFATFNATDMTSGVVMPYFSVTSNATPVAFSTASTNSVPIVCGGTLTWHETGTGRALPYFRNGTYTQYSLSDLDAGVGLLCVRGGSSAEYAREFNSNASDYIVTLGASGVRQVDPDESYGDQLPYWYRNTSGVHELLVKGFECNYGSLPYFQNDSSGYASLTSVDFGASNVEGVFRITRGGGITFLGCPNATGEYLLRCYQGGVAWVPADEYKNTECDHYDCACYQHS